MIPLLQQTKGFGGLGGLLNSAEFILSLRDLGNGAVDTALDRGVGPATFTRATAAAAKLASGLWKLDVASGTARSSYLGLTTAIGAYGGYLSEGPATQLLAAGTIRDMSGATWAKVTMTAALTSTGIDGTASSCSRVTASGANSTILQTITAAASSRTYSCWIKRITGTGTILLKSGAATLDITALINSANFTLVQLNDSTLNTTVGFQINTSGDAIDVDCNQFEAGAFATTPIPAAGSRNTDALTYPTSGNFSDAAGSCYAEYTRLTSQAATANARVIEDGAGGLGTILYWINATNAVASGDGTSNVGPTVSDTIGTVFKGASSWGSGRSVSGNGSTVATGAYDGSFGFASIGIAGAPSGNLFYGTIKNVRIWQRQLSDATLQAITT